MQRIGIRREDKNLFERRVPLIPVHAAQLHQDGIPLIIQSSARRIFGDELYREIGIPVQSSLQDCDVILGVKEIPVAQLMAEKTYVFFSHTIKGQPYNMGLLRRLMELGCTLIDYEKIEDDEGRRLVFFGRHAGVAGMIDTLWSLGQRLALERLPTPLAGLKPAYQYDSLEHATAEILEVGRAIKDGGLPEEVQPLIFGITGYGNVSLGAQEILDLLQPRVIRPDQVGETAAAGRGLFKVVFREEHLVEPLEGNFELQHYYEHPEKYRSVFPSVLDHLSVLVNCIYWEQRYPRVVTLEDLRRLYGGAATPRLRVIGDISCDVQGSVEATLRATESDNPVFVYDVERGEGVDGVAGRGPVIMSVDNLPAELPKEASETFSAALVPFMGALSNANFTSTLDVSDLPEPLQRAVIVYRGQLTESFAYLSKFI